MCLCILELVDDELINNMFPSVVHGSKVLDMMIHVWPNVRLKHLRLLFRKLGLLGLIYWVLICQM